jgi:nucleoside-diphosphate-sugar epimerase
MKKKILKTKGVLRFKNLNHFRDFISPRDIARIIFLLWKKKYNGIINIGSGHGLSIEKIVLILLKIAKKKKFKIFDNHHPTSLVADISKLKRTIKWKKSH